MLSSIGDDGERPACSKYGPASPRCNDPKLPTSRRSTLVVELELDHRERLTELQVEPSSGLHSSIHLGLEEPKSTATVGFGAIQSQIRMLEKFVGVDTVTRGHCDPDTDADHGLMPVK